MVIETTIGGAGIPGQRFAEVAAPLSTTYGLYLDRRTGAPPTGATGTGVTWPRSEKATSVQLGRDPVAPQQVGPEPGLVTVQCQIPRAIRCQHRISATRARRGETVSYQGEHFPVDHVRLQPAPVQQPYIPVLVAGVGERRTLAAVARYADASNFIPAMVASVAAIERKYAVLREHCAAIGRPSDSVLGTYQFVPMLLADTAAALAAKREAVPLFLRTMDPQTTGGFIGTPDQADERLLALVDAGCQYFILSVLEIDTLRLVAERAVRRRRCSLLRKPRSGWGDLK